MSVSIPVHIVLVLDESGSMHPLQLDLIGGVNQFFADQRKQSGKCRLTLAKFAPFTVIHDAIKIADVPDLSIKTYSPYSDTPLLDAEGYAIAQAMNREDDRAKAGKSKESVLFVTYTDGQENSSREWSYKALSDLKKERTEAGWTFLYLGAGHDAYGQSSQIGTQRANTTSYAHSSAGTHSMTTNTSRVASAYRAAANSGDVDTLTKATQDAFDALGVKPEGNQAPLKASPKTPRLKKTP